MSAPALASPSGVSIPIPLAAGWELASAVDSASLIKPDSLRFVPAKVPGTVASALRDHQAWRMGDGVHFDEAHHLFRCRFYTEPAAANEKIFLRLGGIATLAEVRLNGERILESHSMFASHEVDVSPLIRDRNELIITCYPLDPALRERRGSRPAARWRTRAVSQQQLRWFRTTLLGRAPGFSPEPEPVGPWRPVTLVRRRRIVLEAWTRHVSLQDSAGMVSLHLLLRSLDMLSRPVAGRVLVNGTAGAFEWSQEDGRYHGRAAVRVSGVVPWSPHTHGQPALYPVHVELTLADGTTAVFEDLPAGFRSIDPGAAPPGDAGLALSINGTPLFCRGVVWTPPDIAALDAPAPVVRQRLKRFRDAGFNLIRLAGTTIYESQTFHRLCDELGLLVWQDMMFANMDYPFEDPAFHQTVRTEAEAELSRLSRHPSTAVICGGSEIEQQVAMLGFDPALGRGSFFDEELPRIAAAHCPGVPYIRSSPCGAGLPFHPRNGVAHYFGVGAYRRSLEDVRRAEVRFASECLAFANVAEEETSAAASVGQALSPANDPAPAGRAPRDSGADWDFHDVRDHYLNLLYAVDPRALRQSDPQRYWELSRIVSGEVMAEAFGEWRRPASTCRGGIVLWGADLEPGAGWGLLDSEGRPKPAWWFLKRALAPVTVWTTDEGLNGIDIHVANDRPEPLGAWLRMALYRLAEHKVAEADLAISVAPNTTATFGLEQILGRFTDAACAYHFGPPGHDVIVASLHRRRDDIPFAQSFRFPAGRATQKHCAADVGITAESKILACGAIEIVLRSQRLVWGARVAAPGFEADEAWFGIEPGGQRRLVLTPFRGQLPPENAVLTALNLDGRLLITLRGSQ
jgi:beta-mannosidase